MTDSTCPSLHRFGMLLRAAHILRNGCLADNKDIKDNRLRGQQAAPAKGHMALQKPSINCG